MCIFPLVNRSKRMKRAVLGFGLALFFQITVHETALAQRYVYVDTEYMLAQMSEYSAAQSELKVQVERWNAEADEMRQEIDRLYRTLKAESPLLTESMQRERMDEIKAREDRLLAWQKEQFGEEGALFKKQQDLIRPLQDKIYAAVQKYARDKSYDLIFDRAAGNQLLFVSPKLDKSNEILAAMGVVRKSTQAKAQPKPNSTSKTPPKATQPPAPATGKPSKP